MADKYDQEKHLDTLAVAILRELIRVEPRMYVTDSPKGKIFYYDKFGQQLAEIKEALRDKAAQM